MKKLLIVPIMMILIISFVSAGNIIKSTYRIGTEGASQVRVEEHVREQNPECGGAQVMAQEVFKLNNNQYFQQAMETFDDGYHVVEMTEAPYNGYQYYTIYKAQSQIRNVRQGFCVNGEYHAYEFSLNVQATLDELETKAQLGQSEPITDGIRIMRSLKGLSVYQQGQLIKIGTQYFANNAFGGGNNENGK